MAVLGLRFCARAFSSCSKWGPLFIAVRGPLTITASLFAEHRLQMCRLSSCGTRAQLLHGMWDLPRPGLEPVSPALAGRVSTTAPPGKPPIAMFQCNISRANATRGMDLHCRNSLTNVVKAAEEEVRHAGFQMTTGNYSCIVPDIQVTYY